MNNNFLEEFPEIILDRTLDLNATLHQIETLQSELVLEDYQIGLAISNDETLRNEQMRKAHRQKLQLNPRYQGIKSELIAAKQALREQTAKLDLAQNQFRVAKLQAELTIAQARRSAA